MTLIKRIEDQSGWTTCFYSTDTDPSELGPAGPIKFIWDAKRAGELIPSWKKFRYEDFVGYHGWVAVEDIVSVEPYDSIFRLWGTNFVDVFNLDLTGKKASDYKGIMYTESDFQMWTDALSLPAIIVSEGTMNWVEHYHYLYNKEFADVILPLSDNGNTIDRFLTVTLVKELPRRENNLYG